MFLNETGLVPLTWNMPKVQFRNEKIEMIKSVGTRAAAIHFLVLMNLDIRSRTRGGGVVRFVNFGALEM